MSRPAHHKWLWRADWRAGVVRSRPDFMSTTGASIVVGICGLVAMFGFVLSNSGVMLLAVSVGIAAATVIPLWVESRVKTQRYGTCEFRFDTAPFPLGSVVHGTIVAPFAVRDDTIDLCLVNTVFNDEDSPYTHSERTLMSSEARNENGRTLLPVSLKLPSEGVRPTRRGNLLEGRSRWFLSVKVRSIRYAAKFEIPVAEPFTPQVDTLQARAAKNKLRRDLKVFDEPDDVPGEPESKARPQRQPHID